MSFIDPLLVSQREAHPRIVRFLHRVVRYPLRSPEFDDAELNDDKRICEYTRVIKELLDRRPRSRSQVASGDDLSPRTIPVETCNVQACVRVNDVVAHLNANELTVIKAQTSSQVADVLGRLIYAVESHKKLTGTPSFELLPQNFFSLCGGTRPLALKALFHRLSEAPFITPMEGWGSHTPVIFLSTPERLRDSEQVDLVESLRSWLAGFKSGSGGGEQHKRENRARIVVVCGVSESFVFRNLRGSRNYDLERCLAQLHPRFDLVSPLKSRTHVLHGKPLTGKTGNDTAASNRASERVVVTNSTKEASFCHEIREVLASSAANVVRYNDEGQKVWIDLGQIDLHEKIAEVGVALLHLLVFGVTGMSLTNPVVCGGKETEITVEIAHPFGFLEWFPGQEVRRDDDIDDINEDTAEEEGTDKVGILELAGRLEGVAADANTNATSAKAEDVLKAFVTDLETAGVKNEKVPATVKISSERPFVYNKDSLEKMHLILQRILPVLGGRALSPPTLPPCVLLCGETGTGKTYILQELLFLFEACGFFQVRSSILSLNNAFSEEQLALFAAEIFKEHSVRRFVILDEVNTAKTLDVVKHLLIDRRCGTGNKTQALKKNVVFLATCNPPTGNGLGTYHVYQLPASLERCAIRFPALSRSTIEGYLKSQCGMRNSFVNAILVCQEGIQKLHSVRTSLRDAMRCIRLQHFFFKNPEPLLPNGAEQDTNQQQKNSEILALFLSYGLQLHPRRVFYEILREAGYDGSEGRKLINDMSASILAQLGSNSAGVVQTSGLRENLLFLIATILAKESCLLLGNEGGSKTLSLNLLTASAKGEFAQNDFFKKIPRVQVFRLQLSATTTAHHIQQLTDTVRAWSSRHQTDPKLAGRQIAVIILEELGLARNWQTLRALHHLLDFPQIEPNLPRFAFVSTANFKSSGCMPVDAALANRLLIARTPILTNEEKSKFCMELAGACGKEMGERAISHVSAQEGLFMRDQMSFARALLQVQASTAFWLHLQGVNQEKTRQRWQLFRQNVLEIGGTSEAAPSEAAETEAEASNSPPLEFLIETSLRSNVIRHMLIPWENPAELMWLLFTICRGNEAAKEVAGRDGDRRDGDMRILRLDPSRPNSPEMTFRALSFVKLALEEGKTIALVNPGILLLNALHAVLNADSSGGAGTNLGAGGQGTKRFTSTISYNCMFEEVSIHPQARIVLLAERKQVETFHPALLSRVSIFHQSDANEADSMKSRYLQSPSPSLETQLLSGSSSSDEVLRTLGQGVSEVLADLSKEEYATAIVFTRTPNVAGKAFVTCSGGSWTRKNYLQAADQESEGSFRKKLKTLRQEMKKNEAKDPTASPAEGILFIDFFGCAPSVAMDLCLTLGLGGNPVSVAESMGIRVPPAYQAAMEEEQFSLKLPKKMILLCPPLLASRLVVGKSRVRTFRFYWIDELTRSTPEFGPLFMVKDADYTWRFFAEARMNELISREGKDIKEYARKFYTHVLQSASVNLALGKGQCPFSHLRELSGAELERILDRIGSIRAFTLLFFNFCFTEVLRCAQPWFEATLQNVRNIANTTGLVSEIQEEAMVILENAFVVSWAREVKNLTAEELRKKFIDGVLGTERRFPVVPGAQQTSKDAATISYCKSRQYFAFAPELFTRIDTCTSAEAVAASIRTAFPNTLLAGCRGSTNKLMSLDFQSVILRSLVVAKYGDENALGVKVVHSLVKKSLSEDECNESISQFYEGCLAVLRLSPILGYIRGNESALCDVTWTLTDKENSAQALFTKRALYAAVGLEIFHGASFLEVERHTEG